MVMAAKRSWTAFLYAAFYWIGVVMIIACLAFILVGNTEAVYRFEHTRFPLSWALATVAILAFLAAEFCHAVDSIPSESEGDAELVPDWNVIEVRS
jgi:hypothetical protein